MHVVQQRVLPAKGNPPGTNPAMNVMVQSCHWVVIEFGAFSIDLQLAIKLIILMTDVTDALACNTYNLILD